METDLYSEDDDKAECAERRGSDEDLLERGLNQVYNEMREAEAVCVRERREWAMAGRKSDMLNAERRSSSTHCTPKTHQSESLIPTARNYRVQLPPQSANWIGLLGGRAGKMERVSELGSRLEGNIVAQIAVKSRVRGDNAML